MSDQTERPRIRFSYMASDDGYAIYDDDSLAKESLSAEMVCRMLEQLEAVKAREEAAIELLKSAPGPSANGTYSAAWHMKRLDWLADCGVLGYTRLAASETLGKDGR